MAKVLFSAAIVTRAAGGTSMRVSVWSRQLRSVGRCASTDGVAVALRGLTQGVGRDSVSVIAHVMFLQAFSSVAGATCEP